MQNKRTNPNIKSLTYNLQTYLFSYSINGLLHVTKDVIYNNTLAQYEHLHVFCNGCEITIKWPKIERF